MVTEGVTRNPKVDRSYKDMQQKSRVHANRDHLPHLTVLMRSFVSAEFDKPAHPLYTSFFHVLEPIITHGIHARGDLGDSDKALWAEPGRLAMEIWDYLYRLESEADTSTSWHTRYFPYWLDEYPTTQLAAEALIKTTKAIPMHRDVGTQIPDRSWLNAWVDKMTTGQEATQVEGRAKRKLFEARSGSRGQDSVSW